MENLRVSYISDIHIDMYVHEACNHGGWVVLPDGQRRHASEKPVEDLVNTVIYNTKKPLGEILIIAGDLGHKNKQNKEFIELTSKHFQHTYIVLGNHDYYLINSEAYKYLRTTRLRVDEMRDYIKEIPNCTLLEGQIVKYKDLSISGAVGWHDGKYLTKTLKSSISPAEAYDRGIEIAPGKYVRMNDRNLIIPNPSFDTYFNGTRWAEGNVDIMITHHNPSILKSHQNPKYKNDPLTAFYCFDGKRLFEDKKPLAWVYGHTHYGKSYTYKGCRVYNNAVGYPGESPMPLQLKHFTVPSVQ